MTKAKTGALYGLLLLWSFLCLYPLLWMVGASLKAPMDVMSTFSLFPQGKWHWETYAEVWNRLNFFSYFWNSVIVTLSTLIGINVLYSMAAFAFAKLRFPGNNALFVLFLGMMFVPGSLILPSINGAAPMAIFLFRNYFRSIPHELFESAKMEGAGIMRTLLQIYLPLSVPILATLTAINFLGSWNSLILPMVILSDQSLFTLPIGVMLLDSGVFRQWNVLMAGALISIVPILLCFGFLQKYYIKGLSAGAVKA